MQYFSNTTELLQRLATMRALIASGLFSDALVAGLKAGQAAMMRRIFNQSQDANGASLGPYFSEQYVRDRRRDGRQTARKDLQYTGGLKSSIEVVSVGNTRAECRFTDEGHADIARWQEHQLFNLRNNLPANEASGGRVPVFEYNELEQSITNSTTRALLLQKLNF